MNRLAARVPVLLREKPFRRYWTGQSVSLAGDQISLIALPLAAVLILDADAAQMGLLKTAELLPALLLSLPAGAWADRRARRRHVMIATDIGRALLIASIPLAHALGVLTLAQLYAVALAIGALTVLFDVCNATLFVSLVPTGQFVPGQALLNGSRAIANIGGPGAGGFLVQLLTAPFALLATGLTYLLSAGYLTRVAPAEPPPAAPAKGYFTEGLRWVLANPYMRVMFAASGTLQFFNFIFHTLFVLYATTELGLGPGLLGIALGVGALGGLLGAALTGAVVRRLGVGRTVLLGYAGFTVPLLLIPLAGGPTPLVMGVLCLAEFLSCVGVMLVDIAGGALQAALIPHALRSRVTGAYRMLNHGFRPLGALAGGALGSTLGLGAGLWIGTAGAVLCVLWILPSPIPRLREMPEPSGAVVAAD
ncbi:MFS transporter [Streptomyces litchfieldiae]|uniref:MFS transporter n=1 Tax=Streptomyces litchfieldiae TaxID=3075543 RepID=A0ABU2MUI4_9ACTN|nr:MFS transporter [Streptomyces sp. DSM 44938]MDT0345305.1 MFS transporter [Streptomyces sp. DSM 44938]